VTPVNSGTKNEKKEVCVLIRIKPKYTEEFCIMMVACKELCKRVSKFKKLAKIDEVYSVLGPFDFFLELSEKKYLCSWNDISKYPKKLTEFLMKDCGVSLVGDVYINSKCVGTIHKDNDRKTIYACDSKKKFTLNMKGDKVTLKINGEITDEFMIKDNDYIYRKEEEVVERINRTIFKIRKTLGSYIYETHTLTKFELSEFLKTEYKKLYDIAESNSQNICEFKVCLEEETLKRLRGLQARLKDEGDNKENGAYFFSWENVPGNDSKRLIEFLMQNFKIEWIKAAIIKKNDDGKTIRITNEPNFLSLTLNNEKNNVNLEINDVRTDEFIVKKENGELNIYNGVNKKPKQVHVLIKVKPECTEKFFLAMTIFKSLCNDHASRYLAEIQETCSIIGPFDFLLKLIAKGAEGREEEKTEKINRTIFEIRETLGSYIYETHTIEKFQIPMTKRDLERFFKKKIGEENLIRLYPCDEEKMSDGEIVPHESYEPNEKIDLKEIYAAETTALKKLLKNAKTFLEQENLDKRINDLNSRVEELEKR